MPQSMKILSLTLVLAGWLSGPAHATQVLYKGPQDLGAESALVIRGSVQSVESYWNSKHTKIFTRVRVSVDQTYKGSAGPIVDLVQLGGTVGNVKVTVDGALAWKQGEEVLLFAEPYEASTYQVSGFSQGKFDIVRDAKSGVAYVEGPGVDGLSLAGAPAEGAGLVGEPHAGEQSDRLPGHVSTGRRVPLDQFISHALGRTAGPGVER